MKLMKFKSFKLALLLQIVMAAFNVAYQKYFEKLLDNDNLFKTVMIVLVLFAIYQILRFASTMLYGRVLYFVTQQMFARLNRFYTKLKMSNLNDNTIGTVTSRYINNVGIFEGSIVKPLLSISEKLFFIIIALVTIATTNIYLFIVVALLITIVFVLPSLFINKLLDNLNNQHIHANVYNDKLTNTISGLNEFVFTKSMARFSREVKRESSEFYKLIYRTNRFINTFNRLIENSTKIITLSSLATVAYLVLINKINIGIILFMLSIIPNMLEALSEVIKDHSSYQAGIKTYNKLFEDINSPDFSTYDELYTDKINWNGDKVKLYDKEKGEKIETIEINNLSIKFGERHINYPNIKFSKGKKYIILGGSGTGKSTLLKAIIGDINNYDGEIKINGKVKDKNKELYNNISYLEQFVYLFNDTIERNVLLGDDGNADLLLKDVGLTKYNSLHVISESGNNLSGGEKQKIALARLLARNTDIIFLDEFTANINKEAAKEIEKYIFNLDKTVIMISHRVSEEIMNMADDIIYL